VRQRLLPLDERIERFGSDVPAGANRFHIRGAALGSDPDVPTVPLQDLFAPAQFKALSDDEKLSQPSFTPMHSGVRVGEDELVHGSQHDVQVVYEQAVYRAGETRDAGTGGSGAQDGQVSRDPVPLDQETLRAGLAELDMAGARQPLGRRAGTRPGPAVRLREPIGGRS
jgi:hypothetical protein